MAEYDKNYLQERAREELKRHGFEPDFRAKEYPKIKPTLQKKFPGFTWL